MALWHSSKQCPVFVTSEREREREREEEEETRLQPHKKKQYTERVT